MSTVPFMAIYAAVAVAGILAVVSALTFAASRRQERVREYRRVVRARLRANQDRWIESLCDPGDPRVRVRVSA
jgi:hypothetical protein